MSNRIHEFEADPQEIADLRARLAAAEIERDTAITNAHDEIAELRAELAALRAQQNAAVVRALAKFFAEAVKLPSVPKACIAYDVGLYDAGARLTDLGRAAIALANEGTPA